MTYEIGKRIKKYRESKELAQEDLARACQMSTSYIGKLERGDPGFTNPTIDTISNVAKALGVHPHILLYGTVYAPNTLQEGLIRGPELKEIPLLSGTVSASAFTHSFNDWEGEMIAIPSENIKNKVAWRIQGKSMEPELLDGDIVIIDNSVRFSDGDMVIAENHNGVTVKILKIFKGGAAELRPLNPEFQTIRVNEADQLQILGVVIQLIRNIRRKKK